MPVAGAVSVAGPQADPNAVRAQEEVLGEPWIAGGIFDHRRRVDGNDMIADRCLARRLASRFQTLQQP